jgi:hypothetical protein
LCVDLQAAVNLVDGVMYDEITHFSLILEFLTSNNMTVLGMS